MHPFELSTAERILTLAVGNMQEEQKGTLDSELATVISSIALACKQIASLVTRSGISNLTGAAGGANFSVSPRPSLQQMPTSLAHALLLLLPSDLGLVAHEGICSSSQHLAELSGN